MKPGIGIAWTLAALVKYKRGQQFEVDPGSLAFSVTLFCIFAAICCAVLLLRRSVVAKINKKQIRKQPES